MSFVNTRTSLGEQAALDALIAHTLTELNEDGIYDLPALAVCCQDSLVSVNFPNAASMTTDSFYGNPLLETIDIGKQCSIKGNPIRSCPNLKALILRGTTGMSAATNNLPFNGTPIAVMKAGIFVPRELISNYLANLIWSRYANVIRAIEDMPITDFSTITHTWAQIKSMVDDESFFSSDYTVGGLKQFTYGEHTVYAEIAKIDNTNKYVDFVLKNSDETLQMSISSSPIVSYADSIVKTRIDQIYNSELPSDLKAVISPVSKKYYKYDGTVDTVTASIWLLNLQDVNLNGGENENEGEHYSIFNTADGRIKYNQNTGSQQNWHLGSSGQGAGFKGVNNGGGTVSMGQTATGGLIFGFRIQKTT